MHTGEGAFGSSPFFCVWTVRFFICHSAANYIISSCRLYSYRNEGRKMCSPDDTAEYGDEIHADQIESTIVAQLCQHKGYRDTRYYTKQACVYFFTFVVVFSLTPDFVGFSKSWTLQLLMLIFKPLQGLFNAIIFIHDRVRILLYTDADMSPCKAILNAVLNPVKTPTMLILLPSELCLHSNSENTIGVFVGRIRRRGRFSDSSSSNRKANDRSSEHPFSHALYRNSGEPISSKEQINSETQPRDNPWGSIKYDHKHSYGDDDLGETLSNKQTTHPIFLPHE